MWHEAKRSEKKLKESLGEWTKKRDRRRQYYEQLKDPLSLLCVNGKSFHLTTPLSSDMLMQECHLVPWNGNPNFKIDRFDARAFLDESFMMGNTSRNDNQSISCDGPSKEKSSMVSQKDLQMKCHFERFKVLVQLDYLGVSENRYLKHIREFSNFSKSYSKYAEWKSKKTSNAIGYCYPDSECSANQDVSSSDEEESLDESIDCKTSLINIHSLDFEQKRNLDQIATKYGFPSRSFSNMMVEERREDELLKQLKDDENARLKLPGRSHKKERHELRIKQKMNRLVSRHPPELTNKMSKKTETNKFRKTHNSSGDSSDSDFDPKDLLRPNGTVEFISEFGSSLFSDTLNDVKTSSNQNFSTLDEESNTCGSNKRFHPHYSREKSTLLNTPDQRNRDVGRITEREESQQKKLSKKERMNMLTQKLLDKSQKKDTDLKKKLESASKEQNRVKSPWNHDYHQQT